MTASFHHLEFTRCQTNTTLNVRRQSRVQFLLAPNTQHHRGWQTPRNSTLCSQLPTYAVLRWWNMLSLQDKILIENCGNVKKNFAWRLLKVSPSKADILNTSYKETGQFSHTDSFFCWVMKYCDDWLRNALFVWFQFHQVERRHSWK